MGNDDVYDADLAQTPPIDKDDPCVSCGAYTGYKFSTPVAQRYNYVEGSGQLCAKCYGETYKINKG